MLVQIQEEYERRFRTMQEEIDSLKEHIRRFESTTTTTTETATSQTRGPTPFQDLPQEHPPLPNQDSSYPLFVQGSSTDPISYQGNGVSDSIANTDDNQTPPSRKRTTSPSSDDDDSSEYDDFSNPPRPAKRINGHDTRCLTMQVLNNLHRLNMLLIAGPFEQRAMRLHLSRLMSVNEDDPLPANHIEGAPLADDEPVRFIWAKTIKQSQHNTRMKNRVTSDLIENKALYSHVPQDDFTADNLDTVFDQTFSTLRNRYKAQNDASLAQKKKAKEINKMIKTRRANRKRAVGVPVFSTFRDN